MVSGPLDTEGSCQLREPVMIKNAEKNPVKKRVRRSPEMIVNLIFEAERKGNVAEICRREGLSPNLFYRWKARFREGGINELKQMKRGRKAGAPVDMEKAELRVEIEKLKSTVCDQAVELLLLKKSVHSAYMDR